MEEHDDLQEAIDFFFYKAKELYGDAVESFWMYENEYCPCCNKRKIDRMKAGEDLLLSLNAYLYRDMNVLIAYLLCSVCISDLLKEGKQQKKMYSKIENRLKKAYLKSLNPSNIS